MKIKKGDAVSTPKGAGVVFKVGSFTVVVSISSKHYSFLKWEISKI